MDIVIQLILVIFMGWWLERQYYKWSLRTFPDARKPVSFEQKQIDFRREQREKKEAEDRRGDKTKKVKKEEPTKQIAIRKRIRIHSMQWDVRSREVEDIKYEEVV